MLTISLNCTQIYIFISNFFVSNKLKHKKGADKEPVELTLLENKNMIETKTSFFFSH